jgi:phosphatidylserine/phosphatidylglycerophosphate/cardiolipin synthase-like enzyme/uncharacterized membrane protein YdjX (TVP38/TMEM64 family)
LIDGAAFFAAVRQAAIKARRSIVIMGWDLDSRTRLVGESGQPEDGYPAELAAFLTALVEQRPGLQVFLLLWDFSLLYATEREPFPHAALQWRTPPGVHFSLDNQVPVGSSQHQKIVVIDDCVAFSGGLDLTARRWDTPSHDIANPWRVDAAGKPYRPFHDVQAMVDGDAALALSQLARERWRCVTARRLPVAQPGSDAWPEHIKPDFTNVSVGVARTQPQMDQPIEHREVEQLFLDMIDTAERCLYIENQFFTSSLIADRIARRMQAKPRLETLLIGPQNHESWVEARTMRNGRIRFMQTLADAGVGDRVRLVYPRVENADTSTDTMLHSKVMIIDDRFLRIGSANLNNRSMGTDTECDLVIEASNAEERRGILKVRDRLMADHCGTTCEEVARFFSSGAGSVLEASRKLSAGGHSLRSVEDGEPDPREMARYIEGIADPERPVAADVFAAMELTGQGPRVTLARLAKLLGALLVVVGVTLAWHLTPLSELVQASEVQRVLTTFAASTWAPLYLLAAYLAGGLVAFPLVVLIAATAATFGPLLGFTYALVGSIASALLTYAVGACIGRHALHSFFGPRLNAIRRAISRGGILAVAGIRLVPIAPFTVVNIVAGAFRIRLMDYVVGSVIGLLPGLLLTSALGYQMLRFITSPGPVDIILLAVAGILWLAVAIAAQRLAARMGARQ